MPNIITSFIKLVLHIVLLIGQTATTIPCVSVFYQPEIPNELKR